MRLKVNKIVSKNKPTIYVDKRIKQYEGYMSTLDEKLKLKETNKETDRNADDDAR